MNTSILAGGLLLLGLILGYLGRLYFAKKSLNSKEAESNRKIGEADAKVKEILVEAKEKAAAIILESQKEERDRKIDLKRIEERLIKKEDSLDEHNKQLDSEKAKLAGESTRLQVLEKEVKSGHEKLVQKLEQISGLSSEEAKKKMFEELERGHREELAQTIAKLERDRRDEIEKKSVEIITSVIQRYSRSHIGDITTSVIQVPEDLKGKIIGREGRNIKAFERLTGVEVIVDETPESILLSSFDPLRREIAKIALEKLIKDGRIQPAKIEEKVEEAKTELDERIRKIGEDATYEVGVLDLPKEIVFLLGRLNYRTSYGQNVLSHSVEMAHIAGMIAAELGLKIDVAKKAALVHDIGKAIDHEVEGTHVEIGRKLLKKYGVNDEVIQGMEAHHDEYPYATPESFIIGAADAISAARPGARRDTVEKYLKRMGDIEKAVNAFEGVKQSYAIAAGREVRVFVVPEKIDDFGALELAKKIAQRIQDTVQYPGEIKVSVIREIKAVEYAR